jgi:hypothetical protein
MSLRTQTSFSRVVPVVSIGLAVRAFYNEKEIPRLGEPATVIDEGAIDVGKAIADACNEVRSRTNHKYVGRGKVSAEMFELYFQVITQMLELRFVSRDGEGFQLSESFLKQTPGMTVREYRKNHRNKLEYLARLVQKRVARTLAD